MGTTKSIPPSQKMKLMIALVLTCALFGLHASAQECKWRASNGVPIVNPEDNQLLCDDGTKCKGDGKEYGDDSWKCCNDKGGRVRCPKNHPNLCNSKQCAGGTALCCEKDCTDFGGNKPCP